MNGVKYGETAYCMKCKNQTEIHEPKIVEKQTSVRLVRMIKGTCKVCGTKVNKFIK